MAGTTGLEPAASAVTGQRSRKLVIGTAERAVWQALQKKGFRGPARSFRTSSMSVIGMLHQSSGNH